jgi:CheY-like chemotaxis protein
MPQRRQIEDRAAEQRRILLITEDPPLRTLVSGFLVTMGCACAMVSTRDMDAIIERENFDAVLLDVRPSRISFQHALRKIKKDRPRLSERILLIRRNPSATQTIDLIGGASLQQTSGVQMQQLWAILQERFTSDRPKVVPRKLRIGRVIFDSRNAPVAVGMRTGRIDSRRLAYQHKSSTVDFLIEPRAASGNMSVTGQVLHRGKKGHEPEGVPVLLVSGDRTVARTTTNFFGEFSFECEPVEDGCIEIRLGEGEWISLPLGRMDGEKPRVS